MSRRAHLAILASLAIGVAACQPDGELPAPVAPPPPAATPLNDDGPGPTIDGWFDDWSDHALILEDPLGDATGAFDVTRVQVTSRGSRLYLRFDTTSLLNLYEGPVTDGTLLVGVRAPGGRELRLDLRARTALATGLGDVPWRALDLTAAPNHAGREFELAVDLEPIEVGEGDTIELWLAGSDAIEPARLALVQPEDDEPSLELGDPAPLRVASFNVHEAGLGDPERADAIGRILRAARADVYCMQELAGMSSTAIAASVEAADPHGDGAAWNVHATTYAEFVRTAVVSRSPIVPIPTPTARFAAAVVLLDDGPLAVFSVHLKCCGFFGSEEDAKRLAEASTLIQTLADLRAGALGAELEPYAAAPAVVLGDFNDVGTPELQQLFTSPEVGLTRVRQRHLRGPHVFTWFADDWAYPPAVLDLTFFGGLELRRSFAIDSRRLDAAELAELGLSTNDSAASDHLIVVTDFDAPR